MNFKKVLSIFSVSVSFLASAQVGVGPAPYCMPAYSQIPCNQPNVSNDPGNFINDFIDNFFTTGATTNINNMNTGCQSQVLGGFTQNYINYTCPTHLRVSAGQVIVCNFQSGIIFSQGFAVYVDWNKDCTYDAGEMVCGTPNVPPAATPASANWVVPAVANGAYKMRVRCAYATIGTSIDPCINYGFGETHEYTIYIGSACNSLLPVCTVLPIEMIYFNALALENAAEVRWGTATESNNSYFTVERSLDLDNYELIEKIKGAGTTNVSKNYALIDPTPNFNGTTYYRIKQFDHDGKLGHSEVISLEMNKRKSGLKLMPDPADRVLTMILPSDMNGNISEIVVRDSKGLIQKVSPAVDLLSIEKSVSVNVEHLSSGIYFITITKADGTVITDRFIKN
jgi:hypothetical protein